MLDKGFELFFTKKVQETNVEKSIRGTQNPYTFVGDCRRNSETRERNYHFASCVASRFDLGTYSANPSYTQYKMKYTGLEQQSKELQIAELEIFIKSVMDSRELKRALSVKMSLEGKICKEISKILCVKQSFIYYWRNIFKTKEIEGIRIGYKGSIGYLTDDQT